MSELSQEEVSAKRGSLPSPDYSPYLSPRSRTRLQLRRFDYPPRCLSARSLPASSFSLQQLNIASVPFSRVQRVQHLRTDSDGPSICCHTREIQPLSLPHSIRPAIFPYPLPLPFSLSSFLLCLALPRNLGCIHVYIYFFYLKYEETNTMQFEKNRLIVPVFEIGFFFS